MNPYPERNSGRLLLAQKVFQCNYPNNRKHYLSIVNQGHIVVFLIMAIRESVWAKDQKLPVIKEKNQ